MRLLVIQTAFLGDVILATALLEQIHQQHPDAQLHLLVRKGNESLLTGHPYLNRLFVWDKKKGKYGGLWALLRQIRRIRYDAVLNLQRFGATGLLTALSGAGQTVGFDKNPFSRLFSHRVPHRLAAGLHEVARNALLLTPLKLGGGPACRPRLYPTSTDYEAVRPYQDLPYVCLAPTSVWFTKQFPADQWVAFIREVPTSVAIYLLGAPSDVAACAQIQQQAGRAGVTNLAGRLSLLESAALLQGAAMNYVNDSAPLHLCSAVNAPTTAIFCSTIPDFGFSPLASSSRIVQTELSLNCRPCGLHGHRACPLGHFRCATSIRTEQLLHANQPETGRADGEPIV